MKRVGIVGAGLIGNWHASRWKQLPVELAGYYDRIVDRAEATAQEYGGRAFASLDEFLEAAVSTAAGSKILVGGYQP